MPYAPSILSDKMDLFFNNPIFTPYMSYSLNIEKNPEMIPAAIHVDNTCRPQSVSKDLNPGFYDLINQFYKLTGVPAVLNTSFNRHGISTISSPRQAIEHLLEGCMDYLIISNYLISAKDNRKFNRKKIKIDTELENLKKFSRKRFKAINKFLTKYEKKYYLKSLNRIKLSKNKIINIKNKIF